MPTKTKEEAFHVYGRKAYEEPLQYVKSVPGADVDAVAVEDVESDEGDWVELIAFPASAAIRVIPWEDDDEREE
ncbi:MAG: hypothetical protein R3248_13515 [Candidatus Promineifilaceae bacterium]|nr:hypothetical protein [Candidatus Promineifilaceae bacterium]